MDPTLTLPWLFLIVLTTSYALSSEKLGRCQPAESAEFDNERILNLGEFISNRTAGAERCVFFKSCKFDEGLVSVSDLATNLPRLATISVVDCDVGAIKFGNASRTYDVIEFTKSNVRKLEIDPCCPLSARHVNLSHNFLHEFPNELSGVKTLDLSHNRLTHVDLTTTDMTSLLLNDNRIRNIKLSDPSQNELSLVRLDLSRNQLKLSDNFMTEICGGSAWPDLAWLDFSYNNLPLYETMSFPILPELTDLGMRAIGLLYVHSGWFTKLPRLSSLDLSENPALSGIYGHFHRDTPSLRVLNLRNCGIRTLDPDIFVRLPSELSGIFLSGNEIHCAACNLTWYRGHTKTVDNLGDLECADANATVRQYILRGSGNATQSCDVTHFVNLEEEKLNVRYSRHSADVLISCPLSPVGPYRLTWSRGVLTPTHLFEWNSRLQKVFPAEDMKNDKLLMLPGGTLVIREITRSEIDVYRCTVWAENDSINSTVLFSIRIDYSEWWNVEVYCVLVAVASGMLLTIAHGIWSIIRHSVVSRIKNMEQVSRARHMIENLEKYKQRQMESIHEKYNQRLARISENYHYQMESLRVAYSAQSDRFRDMRTAQMESMTATIDTAREGYNAQMARVREYGARQMERVWESYVNQRDRVRLHTTVIRDRLMHTYHIKQRYWDKILKSLNMRDQTADLEKPVLNLFQHDDDLFTPLTTPSSTTVPLSSSSTPMVYEMMPLRSHRSTPVAMATLDDDLSDDDDFHSLLDEPLGLDPDLAAEIRRLAPAGDWSARPRDSSYFDPDVRVLQPSTSRHQGFGMGLRDLPDSTGSGDSRRDPPVA